MPDNAFVESFNGRLRDELLNETLFTSLPQARAALASWRTDYNVHRPHSQLGWQTPFEFANTFSPRRDTALRTMIGSAPLPVAQPAPQGQDRLPERTSGWIKAGGNVNNLPHDLLLKAVRSEAQIVVEAIRRRLAECGLELHPEKTRIVYCKDSSCREDYEHVSFDFLGYTFQPREARGRNGKRFTNFLPAISNKAAKGIRQTIRKWWTDLTGNARWLEDLAKLIDPVVRGWLNYYGRYYRSECINVLQHVNEALAQWVRRKYKGASTEKLLRPCPGS